MENILVRGDALAPAASDLIVQVDRLDVGKPVPKGWTVTSGNLDTSEIVRVVMRCDLDGFYVGDEIPVGEFFWIPDDAIIGHDKDAAHGHNKMDGGSVDVGCTLIVRGIDGNRLAVSLRRPEMPYGAPAARGTVFWMPIEVIESWPAKLEERRKAAKRREAEAKLYCK